MSFSRTRSFFGRILFALLFLSFVSSAWSQVIWQEDWESYPTGTLAEKDPEARGWDARLGFANGQWKIEDDGTGNQFVTLLNKANECCYWKGCRMLRDESLNYDDVYYGYRFKFDANFDFKNGGKLNGLIGGSDPSPGVPTDGSKGASVSIMWRKYPSDPNNAYMHTYTYCENKDDQWGQHDDFKDGSGNRIKIVREKWYNVVVRIKMNTMNVPDGTIQVWLDGQLVVDRHDFLFRTKGGTWGWHINQLIYFFGGNGPGWAPTRDSYVSMDDWVLSQSAPTHLLNGSTAQPPVAQIQASATSGTAPLGVNFSSTGSYDPDGNITSYAWEFGDGSTATGPVVSHTYTTTGSFTAKLTVTDNNGYKGTRTQVITVTTAGSGGGGTGGGGTGGGGTGGGGSTGGCLPLAGVWQYTDVGEVGMPGNACFDAALDQYQLSASGADIWANVDQFGFVYQQLSGDGEISFQLQSLQNTHAFAKAGLMIREDLSNNSPHAMLVMNQTQRAFQYRRSKGAATQPPSGSWIGPVYSHPTWMRLNRTGNVISAYLSENGTTWALVDTVQITMTNDVYVGVALTSHNNGKLNLSKFSNLTLTTGSSGGGTGGGGTGGGTGGGPTGCQPLVGDWLFSDVGSVALPGTACFDQAANQFQIRAAGADIGGTADEFGFIYQTLSGNGEITVQLFDLQNTHSYAKGGLMIREDLSGNSRHAMIVVNQTKRAFQYRRTKGGTMQPTTGSWVGPTYTHPVWMRLSRDANVIWAYISQNGSTWSLVDTVQIDFPQDVFVGIALTSHKAATYNSSEFNELTLVSDGATSFPVELLDFQAEQGTLGVDLSWTTASEFNNHFFTVERSLDGMLYEPLSEVDGAGTVSSPTSYLTTDEDPWKGLIYYRLSQTDFDGTRTFLSTITYRNEDDFTDRFEVYPNPAAPSEQIFVLIKGVEQDIDKHVRLVDATGREILLTTVTGNEAMLELPANLPTGIYHVMVDYQGGMMGKSVVVK